MTQNKGPAHIGTRYRPKRLKSHYDVVIIGSGMGGLTTASLLADMGWKVAVLEQHYTAGGYTHSYEKDGFVFDVGVHYIGDMGAPTMSRRFMDYLTDGKVQWAPMPQAYDRFVIAGRSFDMHAGREAFRAQLLHYFPQEEQAVDRYLQLLQEAGKAMSLYTLGKMRLPRPFNWGQRLLQSRLPDFLFRTTRDVLQELSRNPEFLAVLTGQYGDNGLPPGKSAFLIHALIARHYLFGGFYPEGGSWKIAEAAVARIQAKGGDVWTYARVEGIDVGAQGVRGVHMADGSFVPCSRVVSAAGVHNTFRHLLDPELVRQSGYDRDLQQVRPSIAHLGLYLGIEGDGAELGLPQQNLWIYPDTDHDRSTERFLEHPDADFPVVYISFPSRKDPDWQNAHPGVSSVEVVAPAPYAWFERWKDTVWGKRGEEYEAVKAVWAERLMQVVYQHVPQIQGKVRLMDVSTPLSTQWFAGWSRGELYGLDHDPERFRQDWLKPETRIPGLWLSGQDILSCGVVGAMMSGVMTAVSMAGVAKSFPVLRRIMRSS